MILIIPASVGILWAGCFFGALFARGFHRLIDSDDKREFDPNKSTRDLERVANLLKSGRHEEAVRSCEALKKSGDANVLVLETMLARAGIHQENSQKPKPLAEAYQLRAEGKIAEAEAILKSLLAENPANTDAALMLMALRSEHAPQRQGRGNPPVA